VKDENRRVCGGSFKNKKGQRNPNQPSAWKIEFGRIRNEKLRLRTLKELKQSASISSRDEQS
jgi:hypothetical protein